MGILDRSIHFALAHTQQSIARSQIGLQLAAKLRNQCELAIARAHGWGYGLDTEQNGEAMWLRTVADDLHYVADIGANKGQWTSMALDHANIKAALLVEPSVSAVDLLRQRFSANPEVEIVEAGAADLPGSMRFFEEEAAGETSSLVRGFSKNGKSREVRITTIDDEVEQRGWPSVDFIKIDAEGYDFKVLEGARRLLADGKVRYGQFEYNSPWRQSGTTLTFAIHWLEDLGYQCFVIRADGLYVPNVDLYREYYLYSNYAFVRSDLVRDRKLSTCPTFWHRDN